MCVCMCVCACVCLCVSVHVWRYTWGVAACIMFCFVLTAAMLALQVESALLEHGGVAEAAVVGFPHDVKGQGACLKSHRQTHTHAHTHRHTHTNTHTHTRMPLAAL